MKTRDHSVNKLDCIEWKAALGNVPASSCWSLELEQQSVISSWHSPHLPQWQPLHRYWLIWRGSSLQQQHMQDLMSGRGSNPPPASENADGQSESRVWSSRCSALVPGPSVGFLDAAHSGSEMSYSKIKRTSRRADPAEAVSSV